MADRNPGATIREARERAQLTQAQLAKRLGVAERTVRGWETSSVVPRARRFALAAELGLSESFTNAETWGREPDLTTRLASKRFVPPELRGDLKRISVSIDSLDMSTLARDEALSHVASYLFVLRADIDGAIKFVMETLEHGRHEINGKAPKAAPESGESSSK